VEELHEGEQGLPEGGQHGDDNGESKGDAQCAREQRAGPPLRAGTARDGGLAEREHAEHAIGSEVGEATSYEEDLVVRRGARRGSGEGPRRRGSGSPRWTRARGRCRRRPRTLGRRAGLFGGSSGASPWRRALLQAPGGTTRSTRAPRTSGTHTSYPHQGRGFAPARKGRSQAQDAGGLRPPGRTRRGLHRRRCRGGRRAPGRCRRCRRPPRRGR
jgi:hypothetical protein